MERVLTNYRASLRLVGECVVASGKLVSLSLAKNVDAKECMDAFFGSIGDAPHLVSLDVSGIGFGDAGIFALSQGTFHWFM
mgnify:CR=1 FL=1